VPCVGSNGTLRWHRQDPAAFPKKVTFLSEWCEKPFATGFLVTLMKPI